MDAMVSAVVKRALTVGMEHVYRGVYSEFVLAAWVSWRFSLLVRREIYGDPWQARRWPTAAAETDPKKERWGTCRGLSRTVWRLPQPHARPGL